MKRASRALVTAVMERASRVLAIADTFSGIKGISPPQLHLLSQASDPAESNLASVLTRTSIVAESTGSMTQLPSAESLTGVKERRELRGCWFWSKKLHFRKNFNFIAVERVRFQVQSYCLFRF